MGFSFPTNMNTVQPSKPMQKTVKQFLGTVISISNSQIQDNQSPDMLNMVLDDKLVLDKRFGYSELLASSIGSGGITGLLTYKKNTGDILLIGHGTKLYKYVGTTLTELYASMSGNIIRGFTYNDYFYMLDGAKYLRFDGTNVVEVKTVAYVPTVRVSSPPTGGGDVSEDFNLIGAGFKQSFSGDGATTTYQLVVTGLDATAVTIAISGVAKTEGTHFTVNRTNGTIDFSAGTSPHGAPANVANNVVVTAYKTVSANLDKIAKCTFFVVWGGLQDTRVFFSGNSTYKNYDFRCGLDDPTYFPENGFYKVGNGDSAVNGYAPQFESLIIQKEGEQWRRDYSLDSTGNPTFTTYKLNDGIGCSVVGTTQIINSKPVTLHKTGVYVTQGTNVKDERNTVSVSKDVNKNIDTLSIDGLLEVASLTDYVSIDFDKKYMLFNKTSGEVWVYDYRFGELEGQWFKWNNMYASCLLEVDGMLYFGDSRSGKVYIMKNKDSVAPYRDVASAINAYVRTKLFDLDSPTKYKFIDKVFYTIKASDLTSGTLKYRTNADGAWQTFGVWETASTRYFNTTSYGNLDYSTFSYSGNIFPIPIREDLRLRKISHIQLEFSNNALDESFGLTDYSFVYSANVEYKNQ